MILFYPPVPDYQQTVQEDPILGTQEQRMQVPGDE